MFRRLLLSQGLLAYSNHAKTMEDIERMPLVADEAKEHLFFAEAFKLAHEYLVGMRDGLVRPENQLMVEGATIEEGLPAGKMIISSES